jgi:hypothetical protein
LWNMGAAYALGLLLTWTLATFESRMERKRQGVNA